MAAETKSRSRWAYIGIVILIVLFLFYAAYLLHNILMPFFLALIFSYLLRPLVRKLYMLGVPKILAIFLLYAYLLIILSVLACYLIPILFRQMNLLLEYLPHWKETLPDVLSSFFRYFSVTEVPAPILEWLDTDMPVQLIQNFQLQEPQKIGRWLLWLILTPVLAYYMLLEDGTAGKNIFSLVKPAARRDFKRLLADADRLMRRFVFGYLIVAIMVAVLSAIYLWLLGVDYPLALGLLMGIGDMVPYIGPIICGIPAVIVAFGIHRTVGILTVIGLFIIIQLESIVITPAVMGDRIGISPLMTIFLVMAGGEIGGIIGAVLAIPLSAAFTLLFRYCYGRIVGAKIGNL